LRIDRASERRRCGTVLNDEWHGGAPSMSSR
jgi:hypothetical protein